MWITRSAVQRHFLLGISIGLYWPVLYQAIRAHDGPPAIFAIAIAASALLAFTLNSTLNQLPIKVKQATKYIMLLILPLYLITTNYWQVIILFTLTGPLINVIMGQVHVNQSNEQNPANRYVTARQVGLVVGYAMAGSLLFFGGGWLLPFLAPWGYFLSQHRIEYQRTLQGPKFGLPYLKETLIFIMLFSIGTMAWSELAVGAYMPIYQVAFLQGTIHIGMAGIQYHSHRIPTKHNTLMLITTILFTVGFICLQDPLIVFIFNGFIISYWTFELQRKSTQQQDGRRVATTNNTSQLGGQVLAAIVQIFRTYR